MGTGIRILREQVADAMNDGASLDDVDRPVIGPAPLSPELRSALWLYAWELGERDGHPPAEVDLVRS
jgi:hypothetical protein